MCYKESPDSCSGSSGKKVGGEWVGGAQDCGLGLSPGQGGGGNLEAEGLLPRGHRVYLVLSSGGRGCEGVMPRGKGPRGGPRAPALRTHSLPGQLVTSQMVQPPSPHPPSICLLQEPLPAPCTLITRYRSFIPFCCQVCSLPLLGAPPEPGELGTGDSGSCRLTFREKDTKPAGPRAQVAHLQMSLQPVPNAAQP